MEPWKTKHVTSVTTEEIDNMPMMVKIDGKVVKISKHDYQRLSTNAREYKPTDMSPSHLKSAPETKLGGRGGNPDDIAVLSVQADPIHTVSCVD